MACAEPAEPKPPAKKGMQATGAQGGRSDRQAFLFLAFVRGSLGLRSGFAAFRLRKIRKTKIWFSVKMLTPCQSAPQAFGHFDGGDGIAVHDTVKGQKKSTEPADSRNGAFFILLIICAVCHSIGVKTPETVR